MQNMEIAPIESTAISDTSEVRKLNHSPQFKEYHDLDILIADLEE